jgi:hypothetical protein
MMTPARWAVRALVVLALVAGIVMMHHVVSANESAAATAGSADQSAAVAVDHHAFTTESVGGTIAGHSNGAAASDASAAGQPSGGHDLLHWCAAVAFSAALLLFGLVLIRFGVPRWFILPRWRETWPRRVWPPSLAAGRSLLMSVCVMRV